MKPEHSGAPTAGLVINYDKWSNCCDTDIATTYDNGAQLLPADQGTFQSMAQDALMRR